MYARACSSQAPPLTQVGQSIGCWQSSSSSIVWRTLRSAGVSVTPALIELAVIPRGASSKASWRMWLSSADFAAETAP